VGRALTVKTEIGFSSEFSFDAPDDAALAKAILTLAKDGNVKSETLKAFTEDEYRKIIGSL